MKDRIFDIQDKTVLINENVLLIPELKALVDKYEQPVLALAYCYYMTSPSSPYSEYEEDLKEEMLLADYKGDYNKTDLEIANAINKLTEMYKTTVVNYYLSIKKLVDKLATYASTVLVDDSKETGNIQHVLKMVKECGAVITQFKKLEKEKDEELLKTRGNRKLAYDQQ